MKKQIEIDDTLAEIVAAATDDLEAMLKEYIEENKPDSTPCLSNDLDYGGQFNELVDSAVPIYTHEIDTIFYLHRNRVEEAYDNAGIGNKNDDECTCSDWRMVAIYCYIEQELGEWYGKNAEGIFDEWQEENTETEEATK